MAAREHEGSPPREKLLVLRRELQHDEGLMIVIPVFDQ